MNILLVATVLCACATFAHSLLDDDGIYRPDYLPYDDGKYRPTGDEGKYYHVGDGDRGPYREGYLGGFGKYDGQFQGGNYVHDTQGIYKKPVVTTPKYDEGGSRIIQQRQGFKDDTFHHFFETENGIFHVENGKILNPGTDAETIHTKGFYEYTGTDGMLHRVDYSAGSQGFVARAKRLPTPPPKVSKTDPRPLHDLRLQGLIPTENSNENA